MLAAVFVCAALVYGTRRDADQDEPPVVARAKAQPVEVVTARRAPIQAWLFAEGTARSVQREYLTFEMAGRVTFVGPEKPGERVKKGQVLAQLDKRKYQAEVETALAALEEARTNTTAANATVRQSETQYEVARRDLQRIEQLVANQAATQTELDQARARLAEAEAAVEAAQARALAVQASIAAAEARLRQAQVTLEETEIVSPIDGVVAYLNVEEGWYFTPNIVRTTSEAEALVTVPMVVIDPSQYEIRVAIPSFDAGRVEVGQPVIILPGGSSESEVLLAIQDDELDSPEPARWTARGEVYSVNPAVNPGGRSIEIEIRTTDGAEQLRDGMFVACWIATEQKSDALIAPFDALLYEENQPYVFVVDQEANAVHRQPVQLGIRGLRSQEIVAGVEPNALLVTHGRYRLVDGAPVRVLESPPPDTAP